ncbi:MAG: rhodanese-like domain-containing protein [Saprospiraceae bacterium]|nr:rhodanese-like domain-containing protein [Saprospiraceae bacterium]
MINFIKKFLNKEKVDYNNLMNHGAIVLDVRTQNEFESGHIPGSINIPVQILESQLKKLDKNKTIITCCASGMRSATARQLLLQHGFHHVYNGGGWNALYKKLQ